MATSMSLTKCLLWVGCAAAGWLALSILLRATDPPTEVRPEARGPFQETRPTITKPDHDRPALRPKFTLGSKPKAIEFKKEIPLLSMAMNWSSSDRLVTEHPRQVADDRRAAGQNC